MQKVHDGSRSKLEGLQSLTTPSSRRDVCAPVENCLYSFMMNVNTADECEHCSIHARPGQTILVQECSLAPQP